MKSLILKTTVLVVTFSLFSCGRSGSNGQLTGVLVRPSWAHIMPYGMVYIPSGVYHMGQRDQDINHAMVQRTKSVSIQGFYMDDTEISNNEYRQFVNWVRDSIAHKTIGGEHILNEGETNERIDWDMDIDWEDPEVQETLADMYYAENERFWGQKDLDVRKLNYYYEWIDLKEAAKLDNKSKPRTTFLKNNTINVYPDTLVWVRDFTYSYNEPMTRNYFWHPAFDDYPAVGVNWVQASAFGIWRSRFWNDYRTQVGETIADYFRLPYESEWEYAAAGGKKLSQYPWGGPYIRNTKGCILANFKPMRGNYPEDGGYYTVKVDGYWPNDYGLYNMAGNVAEWTSTAYFENATSFVHDLNADIVYDAKESDPKTMKRKVIRGGSWKDVAYYLQNGSRQYEYQDTAKSYIGFRCSITFLGRSIADVP